MEDNEKSTINSATYITEAGEKNSFSFGANDFCVFIDADAARNWVLHRLHPSGAHCPKCHARPATPRLARAFWAGRRIHCGCGRWFSALSGTLLNCSKLSYSQFFLMGVFAEFLSTGLTPERIAASVGISTKTLSTWLKKIKNSGGKIE